MPGARAHSTLQDSKPGRNLTKPETKENNIQSGQRWLVYHHHECFQDCSTFDEINACTSMHKDARRTNKDTHSNTITGDTQVL